MLSFVPSASTSAVVEDAAAALVVAAVYLEVVDVDVAVVASSDGLSPLFSPGPQALRKKIAVVGDLVGILPSSCWGP